MKLIEAIDVILGTDAMAHIPQRLRPICRIGAVVGMFLAIMICGSFLVSSISELIAGPSKVVNWLFAAFVVLVTYGLVVYPLILCFRLIRHKGQARKLQELDLPCEGLVLKRMFSQDIIFFTFWCFGWNSGLIFFIIPEFLKAADDYGTKGFQGILPVGIVFTLAGVAVTIIYIMTIIKRCMPTYEIQLSGAHIVENGRVTFDYRFLGNPEKVRFAEFALASENRRYATGNVTDEPGTVDDSVTFDTLSACTAGHHTFKMPEIPSDCHDEIQYYIRISVKFACGLKAVSTYRIPLRRAAL